MSSPEPEVEALPVMFTHCRNVYDAMLAEAQQIAIEGTNAVVYEGHLTRLITGKLHLSVPYYSSVTKDLKRMGCIRQLRRGGGNAPSQWELIREPTEDLYRDTVAMRRPQTDKCAILEQQMRALTQRVSAVETMLSSLARSG